MGYRCSLCAKVVPLTGTVAHSDMHRAQPDWQHVIGYVLVEA